MQLSSPSCRSAKYLSAVILASAGILFIGCELLRQAGFGNALIFDHVNWIVANLTAAILAWLGVGFSSNEDRTAKFWFALGLSLRAIGEVLWAFQTSRQGQGYPTVSDLFYLCLGPCCAMGFISCLRTKLHSAKAWLTPLVDILALSLAVLALTLALYLSHRTGLSGLPLLTHVLYPVALLGAACIGIVAVLTLRPRLSIRWGLFIVSLVTLGIIRMRWNSILIDSAPEYGSWFNLLLVLVVLLLGIGALAWRMESSDNRRWNSLCDGILRLLPVFLAIVGILSLALVWEFHELPNDAKVPVSIAATLVIVLAIIRQSLLLAEGRHLRQMAHEEKRLAAERLILATQAGKVGVWDFNVSSGRVIWDDQMRVLYGYSPRATIDTIDQWFGCIHPDDLPKATLIHQEALNAGTRSFKTDIRIYRPNDGELRHMRVIGSVLTDEFHQSLRIIGISWDVTEERVTEEHLTHSLQQEKKLVLQARAGERAKSEFLSTMSHEIRTPINGILGFANLLNQLPQQTIEGKDYSNTIIESSEALLRIIDDILDFSRLESGQLKMEERDFSIATILEDIHLLLLPSAQEKLLGLELLIDRAIPLNAWGDGKRLRQILFHLVGNAVKFTETGSVTFGVQTVPGSREEQLFFVRDTGAGIPSRKLSMIFQPFIQIDGTDSRRYGGTGLGLAIAQRLANLIGARLSVESEVGNGSEFHLITRLAPARFEMRAKMASAAEKDLNSDFAISCPLKILLVDDDKTNLKLVAIVTRKLGYEPLLARDGREAVKIFKKEHPDFVLTDIQMPNMDGMEAARTMRDIEREEGRKPSFITAFTASMQLSGRQRCFDAGMDYFLSKPLRPHLLMELLKSVRISKTAVHSQL